MSNDTYAMSGYFMDFEDLNKVVPNEFAEFKKEIEDLLIYFKLQEKPIRLENVVVYLEDGTGELEYILDNDELLLVEEKIGDFLGKLKKAFLEKTQLQLFFYYSGTNDELYVQFSQN